MSELERHRDGRSADGDEDPTTASRPDKVATIRPVLQALARIIATDRRAVILATADGRILLANQAAERLKIDRDALLTRLNWRQLCDRAKRAASVTMIWDKEARGDIRADLRLDGEVVHVPMGPVEAYMLRLAESDQESTWLRNRARSATLMRVAHDLRTPIQSLLASANALMQGKPERGSRSEEKTLVQGAAGMRRAAELALDNISNVLAVIRGEDTVRGGQPDEDFSIAEEIRALVAMIEPIAHARAAEIRLDFDGPADLTLNGPLRFVRALCQNLIDNSVNHGGGLIELRVACAPLSEPALGDHPGSPLWRVELDLRDEGGGLPADQRRRLARALGLPVDPQPDRRPDGRPSAGLNVMAHALRQLGGWIEIFDRGIDGEASPSREKVLSVGNAPDVIFESVQSESKRTERTEWAEDESAISDNGPRVIGTIFRVGFSLPAAPALTPLLPMQQPDSASPMSGRTIVLVEDSPASRDWLTRLLQSLGASVIPTASAPEALAFLSRRDAADQVSLVLTDVTLPRMTGIELAARLTGGDSGSAGAWNGVIVGLTAHIDENVRRACLEAGMARVLEKPISAEGLSRALTAILSGATATEETTSAEPANDGHLIDPSIAGDLRDRLGASHARDFMLRALGEARSVYTELQTEGVGPETGRRLHAATGACSLTGLKAVEKRLRAIENVLDAGSRQIDGLLTPLAEALDQSLQMAKEMT